MGLIAVVVAVGVAVATVGALQVAVARAQTAADLAALAGAHEVRDARALGVTRRPCQLAGSVVRANDGRIGACEARADGSVVVTALVRVGAVAVSRSARAGSA